MNLENLQNKIRATSSEAALWSIPQAIIDLLDDAVDEIDQILRKQKGN